MNGAESHREVAENARDTSRRLLTQFLITVMNEPGRPLYWYAMSLNEPSNIGVAELIGMTNEELVATLRAGGFVGKRGNSPTFLRDQFDSFLKLSHALQDIRVEKTNTCIHGKMGVSKHYMFYQLGSVECDCAKSPLIQNQNETDPPPAPMNEAQRALKEFGQSLVAAESTRRAASALPPESLATPLPIARSDPAVAVTAFTSPERRMEAITGPPVYDALVQYPGSASKSF